MVLCNPVISQRVKTDFWLLSLFITWSEKFIAQLQNPTNKTIKETRDNNDRYGKETMKENYLHISNGINMLKQTQKLHNANFKLEKNTWRAVLRNGTKAKGPSSM